MTLTKVNPKTPNDNSRSIWEGREKRRGKDRAMRAREKGKREGNERDTLRRKITLKPKKLHNLT
jgi:hypothetical protein